MLPKDSKDKIIKKFRTHKSDTGSPEVQIAILEEEIRMLKEHLVSHKKDFSSRRGLIKKINDQKKLLSYLKSTNAGSFEDIVKKLKIKLKAQEKTEENA
ncbi:MAG: 30S ribosomal protein S15 [Parcubacteria group bacterium]|nr:30S ribosomal protein S15 [Parcubacteria group bacterium]